MRELIEVVVLSFLLFLLDFWLTRGFIKVEIAEKLSPSARKKRKKGQNFWDWLFFRRYKKIVSPKKLIRYYFGWGIFVTILILQFIAVKFNWSRPYLLGLHAIIVAVSYVPLGIERVFSNKKLDE